MHEDSDGLLEARPDISFSQSSTCLTSLLKVSGNSCCQTTYMPVSCLCQLSPFWLVACHKMALCFFFFFLQEACSSALCLCNISTVSHLQLYVCVHRWNCSHVYIHAHLCARLCLSNMAYKHFPHVQSCQTQNWPTIFWSGWSRQIPRLPQARLYLTAPTGGLH